MKIIKLIKIIRIIYVIRGLDRHGEVIRKLFEEIGTDLGQESFYSQNKAYSSAIAAAHLGISSTILSLSASVDCLRESMKNKSKS